MNRIFKMLVVAISIFTVTVCANASGGGQMGRDMPPRFEKISEEDFYSGLNLNSSVKAKLEVILEDFKATLKTTLKNSQMPPKREVMEPLIEARNAKVEPLLTEAQYETFKKTVEGLFVPEGKERPRM